MADEEAEQDRGGPGSDAAGTVAELRRRLQQLQAAAARSCGNAPVQSSAEYCQEFCRTLLEFAGRWSLEEEPLPLLEVYIVALLSYVEASPFLTPQCENVQLVVERLSLSFVELLLSLKEEVPEALWNQFKSSVQFAACQLQENGITQLSLLSAVSQHDGVWTNQVLRGLLSGERLPTEQVEEFLVQEGPVLLEMRVKQLTKEGQQVKATLLAKTCSQSPAMQAQGPFRQLYLVCLCATSEKEELMEELSKEDCRDALEMICNLESDRDEKAAFSLCSAFLTRQLVCGDTYCAWELTLFWSKLLKRLEPSEQAFLEQCRQMSLLSKTVYHILFLIKVIQSEIEDAGLPTCVEMCVRALRMASDDGNTKATLCKTISCLLPDDLEVKRACQLTEFLLEPTVDAYYAVEALYNEPDQKLEEESMPVPNSLRCELLLVFKTQWPFDPEFWDWRTLKRNCLSLMGEEASIVSSIDLLNDNGQPEEDDDDDDSADDQDWLKNVPEHVMDSAYEVMGIKDKNERKREMKRLREKGFISARYRNWQAYMQYCVLCDKEFLGHRIVRHAQIHMSSGVYTCPICAQTFTSKDTLVPHVKSHVKQSCKERLTAMKTTRRLANPAPIPERAPDSRVKTERDTKEKADGQQQGRALPLVAAATSQGARPVLRCNEDNVCPVGKCRKSFKFFKNLVAHVKAHGDDEEAQTFLEMHRKKVVCQYCRRYFISVTHLNDHLQVHCGAKPYICIQLNCKESFLHNTELLVHRRTHPMFRARCMFPNCGKVFSEAFKLYDHEAQHYKTFTCSDATCGKVFHSQKQLDLHLERHTSPTEEGPASVPQRINNMSCTTSLIQQMLESNSRVKPQNSQESLDQKKQQISLESLLKHSKMPVVCLEQCRVDPVLHGLPLSYNQTRTVKKPVATPPVTPHVPETQKPKDEVRPIDHIGQIKSHSISMDVPQGQHPAFAPNNSLLTSNNKVPLPGQPGTAQLQCSAGPTVSNLLPSTATPQPFMANKLASTLATVAPQTTTAPPAGHRERYHCPFENCTRNYSCHRSVTKHMRVSHSEFYQSWKLARTKIKVTYAPVENTPSVQNQLTNRVPVYEVQRQNVTQSTPYANNSTGVTCATVPPPSTTVQNHSPAALMMDSLVLPQPRTLPDASCQKWNMAPGSDRGQTFPSNLQPMPQVESMNPAAPPPPPPPLPSPAQSSPPSLSGPACSMMASTNRPVETLQSLLENHSQPVMMSYIGGPKSVLHQAYTPQTQGSLVPTSRNPEEMKVVQTHLGTSLPDTEDSATRKLLQNIQDLPESDPEQKKQARRSKRSKWPAIVRDGKFICCRCFRQFNSPKSLGGHLSKRVICKPYDESELNTELPLSFLDFLNSETSADAADAQASLPYGPLPLCQEKLHQPGGNGPAAVSQYPQVDLLGYGNGDSNYDAAERLSAEPSMTDVFMHCPDAEPLFSSPCAPYGTGECLPSSSHVQHTENINSRQKDALYGVAHYTPQPCMDTFANREYSDPPLSHILMENASPSVPVSVPCAATDLGGGFRSDGYGLHPAIQTPATNPDPVTQRTQVCVGQPRLPVSPNPLDTQRKATEQEVKKRLREQILAGDFQRRSNLCHSNSTDPNANIRNPIPSGPVFGPAGGSQRRQDSCDAKPESSVARANFSSLPDISADTDILPNTQSFTRFRETSAPQTEVLSPTSTIPSDIDVEPTQLTASQQQWMTEIQSAFERLDLVRELSNQMSASVLLSSSNSSAVAGHTGSQLVPVQGSPTSSKAFACESKPCQFSTSSAEALWKHLSKTHNYTLEMVNVVKKKYGQYAPFKCLKCSKNFTRNSNLRHHYKTAHQLSQEEVEELDLKRRKAKAAASATVYAQASPAPVPAQSSPETKPWPQPFGKAPKHVPCATPGLPINKYPTHTSPLTPIQPLQATPPQTNIKQPPANGQSAANQKLEPPKKMAEKRPGTGSVSASPYRPYRCVHQGCFAAFTIQHNLILHYRAVHQTALSALEVNKDQKHDDDDMDEEEELLEEEELEEDREVDTPQISEFWCQVKDCSRVFQEIPNLLQHYVQLHKFGLDRVGIFLSTIKSGRFSCGYQGCPASFPSCWKYLVHVKEEHKNMFGKAEQLDGVSFRCEIEGCDRSYSTKSNLLRHFMKKHQDLCPAGLKNQRMDEHRSSKSLLYPIGKTSNGKENIESNKKIVQKGGETKKESKEKNNHWSKYGKPSLKSKSEASAMCTKGFPLQYPCLIKGCESVMKSERNILKHYIGHGLSEKYVEQQRSYFIFCKKVPRQKCHSSRSDDSRSDNTSDLSDNDFDVDDAVFDDCQDDSKPVLRKRVVATEVPAALLGRKLSNEDSSDGSAVVKRKRGRPRKLTADANGAVAKRKKIPRSTKSHVAYSLDDESDSSSGHAAATEEEEDDGGATETSAQLASFNFKPMGFEVSFLKFLEQSTQGEGPLSSSRTGNGVEAWGRTANLNTKDTCVRFKNRRNIRSLNRVKVVIDRVFSGVADLMLKQLQDMQPTVVLGVGR